jgi:hypothetical protein
MHHALMIEFTSNLLKLTGDLKPTRNPAGAGAGVTFHPWMWPQAGFYQTRPVAIHSQGLS